MSRWKETLCGTVIKVPVEASLPVITEEVALEAKPDLFLSCGGIGQPTQKLSRPVGVAAPESPFILFLPKDQYLYEGVSGDICRYQAPHDVDITVEEEAEIPVGVLLMR